MSEERVKLAPVASFREGKGYSFTVDGEDVAVFYVEGNFYAVSNVCPHQHVPLIAEGELNGLVITCPMHGWSFNLQTGNAVAAAGALRTYETIVENGNLYVAVRQDRAQDWC